MVVNAGLFAERAWKGNLTPAVSLEQKKRAVPSPLSVYRQSCPTKSEWEWTGAPVGREPVWVPAVEEKHGRHIQKAFSYHPQWENSRALFFSLPDLYVCVLLIWMVAAAVMSIWIFSINKHVSLKLDPYTCCRLIFFFLQEILNPWDRGCSSVYLWFSTS